MGSNARPELMDAVINYASDGIITMDADGLVVSFNPAAEQIFGYTSDEVIGHDIAMLMPESYRESFRRQLQDFGKDGEDVWPGRPVGLRGMTKSGDEFPVDWSINAMHVEGQRLFVVMLHDVGDRQLLESRLRHAQKMEAVGELVGGMAHNFNNMLAAIVGNVGLARFEAAGLPRLLAYLESIEEISLRAGRMVEQLMVFASRDFLRRKQNMPLTPLVTEAFDVACLDMQGDIGITLEIRDRALIAHCDAGQIRQTVISMIDNARQAVAESREKRIHVVLEHCVPDTDFLNSHFELEAGDYARIEISDSGCGMDARTMIRMFEPFFTTRDVGQGIGLGLSTAFGTVSSHNGVIDVESRPGGGTTFLIYLPLVEGPRAAGEPAEDAS